MSESKVRLEELRELAREQLRSEYMRLREARVKLWLSGVPLVQAREGKIPWRT